MPGAPGRSDGAASFVNPMTVLGMVETMRMEEHSALVHTAAASSLGQMLSRLCIEQQIPLVNIVRKPDQEAMLRATGAVHVASVRRVAVVTGGPGRDDRRRVRRGPVAPGTAPRPAARRRISYRDIHA